jgi:hypothetical protein
LLLAAAVAVIATTAAEARGMKRFSSSSSPVRSATASATPAATGTQRNFIVVSTGSRTAASARPAAGAAAAGLAVGGAIAATAAADAKPKPVEPDWTAAVPPCGKPEVTPCKAGELMFLNATIN